MAYERGDLGGFDPLAFAQGIQQRANDLTAQLNSGASWLQSQQQRVNRTIDAVTGATMTAGQVVQGITRGGIATAATGDAGTGLAAAAASTRTAPTLAILAGAMLTWWIFAKHPGKRGL